MAGASLLVWQEGQQAGRGAPPPPPGSGGTRGRPGSRSAFGGGRVCGRGGGNAAPGTSERAAWVVNFHDLALKNAS